MLPPKRFVRRQMRIRQHPTYRHRQLCTIVAIIRNLSKFETIFYRYHGKSPSPEHVDCAMRQDGCFFGALAIGKADTPVAPAISPLPPKASKAQYAYAAPLSRPPYGMAQYASHLGASHTVRCAPSSPNPPARCAFHRITAPSLARPFRVDTPLPRYRKYIDKVSTASVSI